MLPVISTVSYAGRARQIAWAEETVQLKDYGEARQITLFEHSKVALQILTSDFGACPAEILAWLKPGWREENFLKYASENYGTGKICDYLAGIEANTKITGNPARKADGEDFQSHVAAGFGPFVVLLGQHRADQADDRVAAGEDADHVGAAPKSFPVLS
jgi:hypothetical protein